MATQPALVCDFSSVLLSLSRVREFVDPLLAQALELSNDAPDRLAEAMRHSLLAPGKRLRPALVLWSTVACGGSWEFAKEAAMAVEMIHAYSLVHDDLPAMDDDDLRRGRPTCHRQFDEATAILCGDALQALAFETLCQHADPSMAGRWCAVLARAAGAEALCGGQADDLAAESKHAALPVNMSAIESDQLGWLEKIHRRKTGELFCASIELGAIAAGADTQHREALSTYARSFGLAFQIADDILDAQGSEVTVGKRVGKDADRGKLKFPSFIGIYKILIRAESLAQQAVLSLECFGDRGTELAMLARWIVERDH